jgi:hypothetical protein
MGAPEAHAQRPVQTSVQATRAFVLDTCPVLQEQWAINPDFEPARSEGMSALGLGAQFLTSLADTGWGMVASAFERAGRDATYSVDAGAGFDFYQTYVGEGGALAFTMRGGELTIDGPPFVVGDQEAPPTRRYRCLVLASGLFGYSAGPIDMSVELSGHWQAPIVRADAGETLQHLGLAASPDLYVEALIMEDQALGGMAVRPILVRYARALPGLRGNRELDATLSLVFSKTPTLARSTERDEADVFAALLLEFGSIRPGTLLGPLELSGAGVSGLPMRPTDDEALDFVRQDFAAGSRTEAQANTLAGHRRALYAQGVGVAPVWVEAAFVVTRPGNPFFRAVGEAMRDTRDEASAFFRSELSDRVRRRETRVDDREAARGAYDLAMIDVQLAQLELAQAAPGTAEELQARRTLVQKQYDARRAARAAGLPEPAWP